MLQPPLHVLLVRAQADLVFIYNDRLGVITQLTLLSVYLFLLSSSSLAFLREGRGKLE